MNPFRLALVGPLRLRLALAITAVWSCSGTIAGLSTAFAATDTNLNITIIRTNQNVLLQWIGSSAIGYQVESSSNLINWANSSLIVTGNGGFLSFTNSIVATNTLFRIKKFVTPEVITASFDLASGILTIFGDAHDNSIVVSRNAAGTILVNGGAVPVTGGTPTVANTALIQIFGQNGNDNLALNESNGALPAANLYGEVGNDTLTGGSGADYLDGGPGDDILLGKGGADILHGGDDNDTLTGGDGNDQLFGEQGNDRLIWNPGDDTDLNEGGTEIDTVEINAGNGAEDFTITANGTRVRFDRINPAPFNLDIGTCESLVLNANGGNDTLSCSGNLAALIAITADGGPGDDTLLGSNGADTLIGGDDNDFIDGNQGNDTILMGAGNDTFQWDPGDGSDVVEGQDGTDTIRFNGSAANEMFNVSPNGSRLLFTRDIGAIVLDADGIEILTVNSLAGTDSFTFNNLAGTDVTNVIVDLASTIGGVTADGAADTVYVNGTAADDIITATMPSGDLLVNSFGLAATVVVRHFDTTVDTVRIQGLAGNDIIDASAVPATGPLITLDGGTGNDILFGSAGTDTLLGGDNDDVLLGGGGTDVLDGGLGENTLFQDSTNFTTGILSIFGTDLPDSITISRDGLGNILTNGVQVTGSTIANTSVIRVFGMGGDDVIALNEASGPLPAAMLFGGSGNDTITGGSGNDLIFGGINDDTLLGKGGFDFLFGGADNDTLTGGDADDQCFGEAGTDRMIWNPGDDTDLNEGGSGTDTVEINGGNGAEDFTITANGTRVRFDRINPAPFFLDIGTCESLLLNANGGNDTLSCTGNLAPLISITADGGPGDDTLLGSNGADTLIGGDDNDFIDGNQGNDTILMGAGNDTFQWDPGDGSDIVEGQADMDTMIFNGSAANEIFNVSPNGGRVLFTRNIGSIVTDLDDVETININALGGIDAVTVNDMSGTDLTTVNVDLASSIGGATGDGAADAITINGTPNSDSISLTAAAGVVQVSGLAAIVRISHSEPANDNVTVNGLAGTDSISVGAGVTALIGVTSNP